MWNEISQRIGARLWKKNLVFYSVFDSCICLRVYFSCVSRTLIRTVKTVDVHISPFTTYLSDYNLFVGWESENFRSISIDFITEFANNFAVLILYIELLIIDFKRNVKWFNRRGNTTQKQMIRVTCYVLLHLRIETNERCSLYWEEIKKWFKVHQFEKWREGRCFISWQFDKALSSSLFLRCETKEMGVLLSDSISLPLWVFVRI